jgi:predicted permease
VTTGTISLPNSKYSSAEQKLVFYQSATENVAAIPGVTAVAMASHLPLGAGPLMSDFTPAGAALDPSAQARAQLVVVTPGYFDATRIQLIRGRGFAASDRLGAAPVVIVDATLAQRTWPGVDAVGQRIRVGAGLGADTTLKEVIGVVDGVRSLSLERPPEPMIYLPYAQTPWPTMSLVVRSNLAADRLGPLLAAAVSALDADQPVYNVRSLEQVVDRALAYRRFQTTLLGGFAISALLLAVLGVYGVLAFGVARRTRELGIRAALGATRARVMGGILRHAALRIAAGLLLGSFAALGCGRLFSTLLYGVSPADPLTFVDAAVLLLAAGLLAGYLPAKRAMNVDPADALREQA